METVTVIEGSTTTQRRTLLAMAREADSRINLLPPGLDDQAQLEHELNRLYRDSVLPGEVRALAPWMPGMIATVCAPDTPLQLLIGLKTLARSLAARVESASGRSAVAVLDYAADAAALVHHHHDTCADSPKARYDLYEDLGRIMASQPLGLLFNQAAEQLAQRVSTDETIKVEGAEL